MKNKSFFYFEVKKNPQMLSVFFFFRILIYYVLLIVGILPSHSSIHSAQIAAALSSLAITKRGLSFSPGSGGAATQGMSHHGHKEVEEERVSKDRLSSPFASNMC